IVVVGVIALRIAGVKAAALAVGGAFTAVIVGLLLCASMIGVMKAAIGQKTMTFAKIEPMKNPNADALSGA
ncbi:MAG TPA: hypothetical protein PLX43_04985, partial [Nitrobacter sp.]|nr:hypothetical protein [Nitrobacter sp.]